MAHAARTQLQSLGRVSSPQRFLSTTCADAGPGCVSLAGPHARADSARCISACSGALTADARAARQPQLLLHPLHIPPLCRLDAQSGPSPPILPTTRDLSQRPDGPGLAPVGCSASRAPWGECASYTRTDCAMEFGYETLQGPVAGQGHGYELERKHGRGCGLDCQ